MKQNGKRPLLTAAKLVLTAGAILAGIYAFAEFTLGRTLKSDAVETAQMWSRSVLGDNAADVGRALAEVDRDELARSLGIATIDRIAIIPQSGAAFSVHGADAAQNLEQVVAMTGGQAAGLSSPQRRLSQRSDQLARTAPGPKLGRLPAG